MYNTFNINGNLILRLIFFLLFLLRIFIPFHLLPMIKFIHQAL